MSYIKQKKVWTKKFNKEELDYIWMCFKNISPIYDKAWEKLSFLESLSLSNGFFIHPETDVTDNTMGVEPKRIKKYIEKFGLIGLEEILFILNSKVILDQAFKRTYTDEDSMVLWDTIWKDNVLLAETWEETFLNVSKKLGFTLKNQEFFIKNPWIVFYSIKDLDTFIGKQKKTWLKVWNRVPEELTMLFVNPDRFNPKELHFLEFLFGSKQISKLSISNKFYASNLIMKYGSVMNDIEPNFNKKVRTNEPFIMEGFSEDSIKKIIDLNRDLSLHDIDFSKKIVESGYEKDVRKHITSLNKKLSSINVREAFISIILELLSVSKTNKRMSQGLEMILQSNPNYVSEVSTFLKRPITINDVNSLLSVWENRSKTQNVPLLSGKVGSYSYELIDKTKDTSGLYLGFITDCCQVPNMTGFSCLFDGYKNVDSSFFIVKKKDKIYAQSWVWTYTNDEDETILCFDSLEVLGKDLNKTVDIMNCYLEAADKFIDLGFDYITCGADGQSIPKGLKKFAIEEVLLEDSLYEKLSYKGESSYTDTDSEEGLLILRWTKS